MKTPSSISINATMASIIAFQRLKSVFRHQIQHIKNYTYGFVGLNARRRDCADSTQTIRWIGPYALPN